LRQTLSLHPKKEFDVADADIQVVAVVRYDCLTGEVGPLTGDRMLVLVHDKFGCTYLNVYLLQGSGFFVSEFDDIKVPKCVRVANLHPRAESRLQFANRVKVHQGLGGDCMNFGMWGGIILDANDRFVVISASDGL